MHRSSLAAFRGTFVLGRCVSRATRVAIKAQDVLDQTAGDKLSPLKSENEVDQLELILRL